MNIENRDSLDRNGWENNMRNIKFNNGSMKIINNLFRY